MAKYRITRTAQEVIEVEADDYQDALDEALAWENESRWRVVQPGYLVEGPL